MARRPPSTPPTPSTTDTVLDGVGPRLRSLRRDRSMTLAQLTESTGISQSTLSRLESGQRRPTLELLLPLARVYAVPIDELVGAPATGDPRVHLRPVRRHGWAWIPLSRRPGGVQAFKVIMPPRRPAAAPSQASHEGYEWLYVLDGELRLVLGASDLTMRAGEAAEFDTRTPHWIGNAGTRPAEMLILFGPEGQRVHVPGYGG